MLYEPVSSAYVVPVISRSVAKRRILGTPSSNSAQRPSTKPCTIPGSGTWAVCTVISIGSTGRNSADAGLFITGLRGYEKLVSIEEARLKGRDISLIECLTDYLDYMRQINRTTYGAKCPITGGFPHELSEFATEQYLRSKGIDALEQPRILRDINDEFIEEYLQRLGREIPIFKDQAESDTLALSRPGA